LALFIILAVSAPAQLVAQQTGRVTGKVTDAQGAAVEGALILVDGALRPAARAGADGRYLISLLAGAHVLEARRLGYSPVEREVVVSADADATMDFTLAAAALELTPVTAIVSRDDLAEIRERMMEVPGAVALVESDEIRATRQANLHDVLSFTPGVFVQPRFGAADESQISIRGSGLRNNFHARGVNLLVNGMPYRNADGFTDFESLELLTTEAIEVYKGANALRYGGATLGGAINLNTMTGSTATPIGAYASAGSFGFDKLQVSSGAERSGADYYASYARTSLDGYRAWSDQRRDRVNLHAGYRLTRSIDTRAFYLFAHVREHLPGSVDRATLEGDPTAAAANNVTNRWGRDYQLHHAGVQIRAQLSPSQRLEISPYLQYRDIDHPIFEVINQQSTDIGAEIRYENTARLGTRDNRLTIGLEPASEMMRNRQFQNVGGEHGALTRDEQDRATGLALYLENSLSLTPRLTAIAGGRVDRATRKVDDDFLSNGDQSDERVYTPVTPRFGLAYALSGGGQVFANASATVEPPLFLELSSFGNTGGFIDLQAQKAWQYEVGARGQRGPARWEASVYDIELRNEMLNLNVQPFPGATFTVPTYRNSPRTRHYGAELGAEARLPVRAFSGDGEFLQPRVSYTFARYEYVADPDYRGNRIPGAPEHYLNAEVGYAHPSGLTITPSVEWVPSDYYVNSINTERNHAWHSLGLRAEWKAAERGVTIFAAGQNLTNRRMSRSVQVDNANAAYFEPADPRTLSIGARWNR
jgi:iron complex outermembrane receptor protein